MNKKYAGIAAATIAPFWLVLISGCDPDFTRPGNNGGQLPEEARPARGAVYDANLIPALPACGQEYSVSTVARQKVLDCNGFDFTPLYDRAAAAADFALQGLDCPRECRPLHTWENARKWECAGVFIPLTAYATVEKTALCPEADDPRPAGLGAPQPGDFAANPHSEGGQNTAPAIIEEIGDTFEVGCPATEFAVFEYFEDVPACEGVNYQPFVQKAQALARAQHGSLSCAAGCNKLPYREIRLEWYCRPAPVGPHADVIVNVIFEVNCTRP